VLDEPLLSQLNLHFGTMLLQTKFRVLLEPPWGDLALADSTQDGHRRGMATWVSGSMLGQGSEILCKHLRTNPQGLDEHFGQVNGDFADDGGADHPHGLSC
jgi:hypothetical protein